VSGLAGEAIHQAVILAAGVGSRLRPLTESRPKALVPLGGRPLIDHTLDALSTCGVESVVVVVGHARGALERHLGGRRDLAIACVENVSYATTNTLASVACAGPAVEGDFLLLDGDLVFEPSVLAPLLGAGTRLAIDRNRCLDDDAVKIALGDGGILHVGKELPRGAVPVAESIGLARIDRATAAALFPLCETMLAAGAREAYYEAAFQRLIEQGFVFSAADVTGGKWVEIDDHDDLRRAGSLFVAA